MGYEKEQSKLFNCRRKRDLASLLRIELDELLELSELGIKNYNQFVKKIPGKKDRCIQNPKPKLKKIQRRIASLLCRISAPNYLHSAIKGRSYVSNAITHEHGRNVLKVDIHSFFEAAKREDVYRFFFCYMKCSSDVSCILANLTTVNGHLPTGGCSSQILCFYAYKPMFEELKSAADENGLTMTLYVDDITFSGEAANNRFKFKVRSTIRKYGLEINRKKSRAVIARKTKIVTGVALTSTGIKLPNRRQLKIQETRNAIGMAKSLSDKIALAESLKMRLFEASQIEPKFKEEARHVANLIADLIKKKDNT